MGIETALAIGVAAAGAASAGYSANAQNVAAKRTKTAAMRTATVRAAQVNSAADLEKLKTIRRSEQIRGRLRLAGGEAGLADYGSLDALSQQNDLDTGLNLNVLNTNRDNTQNLIGSELGSELSRLSSGYRNPLLSGFEGVLGGASQGLQLGAGIDQAAGGKANVDRWWSETFG